MRIIAGKFKGKKLDFISDEKTRPTSDIVREALFTKIQFNVADSVFLDLFAGSGSIGLEALSRGAKQVFFVEKHRKNCEIIKNNLKTLYGNNYEDSLKEQGQQVSLFCGDYITFLEGLPENMFFDYVYMDPPYKSNYYIPALEKLKNRLTIESMVICEHDKTINPDFSGYEIITQKKYGIKTLSYFMLN